MRGGRGEGLGQGARTRGKRQGRRQSLANLKSGDAARGKGRGQGGKRKGGRGSGPGQPERCKGKDAEAREKGRGKGMGQGTRNKVQGGEILGGLLWPYRLFVAWWGFPALSGLRVTVARRRAQRGAGGHFACHGGVAPLNHLGEGGKPGQLS